MHNMKKLLALVLAAVMVFALMAGCNKTADPTTGDKPTEDKTAGDTEKKDIKDMTAEEKEAAFKLEEAANRTINIGYDGGICLATPAIAQMQGYFEAEGLKTELVRSEAAKEAIGTGKLDTSGNFIAAWAVPAVNGINMKFVAGANTGCQSLYVLADSTVASTADLKGKKIAVPNGIGNSSHNITLRFLGHDKLDPKDFEFVHVETSAVIAALKNGDIDGVTMSDQFAKKFVEDGTLKVIRSITYDDDFKTEACCVLAMNGDFMEKNPITAEKISRAYQKAGIWFENNKEEAVKWLMDEKWISGDYEYCLTLAKELNFNMTEAITEATLRDVVEDYQGFGIMPNTKTVDEIMEQIWYSYGLDTERDTWK